MFGLLRRMISKRVTPRTVGQSGIGVPNGDGVDFKLLTENSNDVIFKIGSDGLSHYVSPSSTRVLSWSPEEMTGKGFETFVVPEDVWRIKAVDARHRSGAIDTGQTEFRVLRKDGGTIWVEGTSRSLPRRNNVVPEVVVVMRDISKRKALEEKLSEMALTDALTGLANRRSFDQAIESEWQRTKRTSAHMSLLLLDLDHFKEFNDHYGHQVGDDCLRMVAAATRETVRRPADIAARYGGEEIAVILPETEALGAVAVAEAIRTAVETLHIPHVHNHEGCGIVTVSIGAATAVLSTSGSAQTSAGLLQAADIALYKAKHQGRNRVRTSLVLTSNGTGKVMTAA